ncbi:hypothetical protein GCM10011344_02370 [Dokdonia pacifica]|uniref:DUF4249 domain-containing protein n=1 Tax=Dokdonia pacifica TaxID=1627892 RepID=A0A238ZBR7_9FLAO|nr:DUF4249 family protein [Dokdonia pacifica]GGG05446.1 hypothetical protein GCM10011344_02370 [Dokdonia pacifica]SNR80740.1 protein of unknown function [Dokdonia pacifica]
MKKTLLYLLIISAFASCEDVVDVDLNSEPPRLVVDALIRVDTSEDLTEANIRISVTSPFFDAIQPAEIESMQIQNEEDGSFVPYEPVPGEPGLYRPFPTTVSPVIDNKILTSFLTNPEPVYILSVTFQDELYLARTSFVPTTPIDNIVQGEDTLFDEDDTEIIISFTDQPDREDFYIFDFDFGEFLTVEDTFFEGQEFEFSYFYEGDDFTLEPGQEVNISILGADEDLYTYMEQLIIQSDLTDNGPFQVPVSTVRGNILNAEGIDNINIFDNVDRPNSFALGYFAIVQEFQNTIVIE